MKKEYNAPKISIIEIKSDDIIRTSGEIETLVAEGVTAGSLEYKDLMN